MPETGLTIADDRPVLELHEIGLAEGRQQVLAGVTFAVPKGAIVAMLGPNGCGKSALVDILSTLQAPTFGDLAILGVDPGRCPAKTLRTLRRSISTVFEHSGLIDEFTIEENIALPLHERRVPPAVLEQRVTKWIRKLRLTEVRRIKPKGVADGQQRRAALARALVSRPVILICDEPTTGQDTITIARYQALFRQLQTDYAMTVLFSTHQVFEAIKTADMFLVLEFGRMIFFGDAATLQRRLPHNESLRAIIGDEGGAMLEQRMQS